LSITAPALKRPWLPIAVTVVVVGVLSAALTSRLLAGNEPGATGTVPTVAAPGVEHAAWKIKAVPGGLKADSKASRRAAANAGPAIEKMLTRLYEGLFLTPKAMKSTVRQNFISSAATAWLKSGAGLPKGAHDVRIIRRTARAVVQIPGGRRAAIRVHVVIAGSIEHLFRLDHRATLWAERDNGWRVVAFEIDQGRRR